MIRSIIQLLLLLILLSLLLYMNLFSLFFNISTEEPLHPFNVSMVKHSTTSISLLLCN